MYLVELILKYFYQLTIIAAVQCGLSEHDNPIDRLLQVWRQETLEETIKQFCRNGCLEGNLNSLKRAKVSLSSNALEKKDDFKHSTKPTCNCIKVGILKVLMF